MFFIKIALVASGLLSSGFLGATTISEVQIQQDIDLAFEMILRTQVGRAICRDILGADAQALEVHLGVSKSKAGWIARNCNGADPSEWIYPTSPNDIRKIAVKPPRARRYQLAHSDQTFPIESWTDPYSNLTTILNDKPTISFPRLVQILAHEMAVYFDSKSHPLYPGAEEIPHLRNMNLKSEGPLKPLVAVSDPLIAHTLTYLRALQVEFAILNELVGKQLIVPPADLTDPLLQYLVSEECKQACIENLIEKMRDVYLPFSLPLLAFSSHYRALMEQELPSLKLSPLALNQAKDALSVYPVRFMVRQFTGDMVGDLSRVFHNEESDSAGFQAVSSFLRDTLWTIEKKAITTARFDSGLTLLEFMKRPLLSGYNIAVAIGPRVRIRTGGME